MATTLKAKQELIGQILANYEEIREKIADSSESSLPEQLDPIAHFHLGSRSQTKEFMFTIRNNIRIMLNIMDCQRQSSMSKPKKSDVDVMYELGNLVQDGSMIMDRLERILWNENILEELQLMTQKLNWICSDYMEVHDQIQLTNLKEHVEEMMEQSPKIGLELEMFREILNKIEALEGDNEDLLLLVELHDHLDNLESLIEPPWSPNEFVTKMEQVSGLLRAVLDLQTELQSQIMARPVQRRMSQWESILQNLINLAASHRFKPKFEADSMESIREYIKRMAESLMDDVNSIHSPTADQIHDLLYSLRSLL